MDFDNLSRVLESRFPALKNSESNLNSQLEEVYEYGMISLIQKLHDFQDRSSDVLLGFIFELGVASYLIKLYKGSSVIYEPNGSSGIDFELKFDEIRLNVACKFSTQIAGSKEISRFRHSMVDMLSHRKMFGILSGEFLDRSSNFTRESGAYSNDYESDKVRIALSEFLYRVKNEPESSLENGISLYNGNELVYDIKYDGSKEFNEPIVSILFGGMLSEKPVRQKLIKYIDKSLEHFNGDDDRNFNLLVVGGIMNWDGLEDAYYGQLMHRYQTLDIRSNDHDTRISETYIDGSSSIVKKYYNHPLTGLLVPDQSFNFCILGFMPSMRASAKSLAKLKLFNLHKTDYVDIVGFLNHSF